jgi:hypothetical protein
VDGSGEDGTAAALGAGSTSDSARSESSPGGHTAVDGASERAAGLDTFGEGANSTAVSLSGNNRTTALLGAGGTSSRAGAEGRPAGKLAVDRALEVVARGNAHVNTTSDTTVLSRSHNRFSALLGATSTTLGAGTPGRPAGKLAVDGASLSVADTLVSRRAFVTTVPGSNIDLVVTGLFTGTARLGASGPGVP